MRYCLYIELSTTLPNLLHVSPSSIVIDPSTWNLKNAAVSVRAKIGQYGETRAAKILVRTVSNNDEYYSIFSPTVLSDTNSATTTIQLNKRRNTFTGNQAIKNSATATFSCPAGFTNTIDSSISCVTVCPRNQQLDFDLPNH